MLNLATQINRRINYLKKYHPPKSNTRVDNSERLLKVYGGDSPQVALDLLIQTAKTAGLPTDSLTSFLRAGYVPQPMQVRIHAAARLCDLPDGPTQIGIGGARGPGKSHGTFAQTAIDDCQRIPGLKVLYLRKIQKNAKEQFEDLRRSVLLRVKHEFTNGVLHFYNGSRMFLGHFRNEGDIDQYLGIEYDLIVIEELTTLSLLKYRALRDSNRTSKPGFRPRIYATFNPGGIGHAWVKALFIVPSRKKKETDTRFIFGTVDDNVFNDPGYKKKLEENTGWRLQAYRYGDWDIAAGQYFSTWNHDAIVRPKEKAGVIPGSEVWCSLDKGLRHPTVAYLFCKNEGGIRVVDEHWRQGALTSENAADIHSMLTRHGLKLGDLKQFVASPDAFSKDGSDSDKSIADEYGQHGIKLTRANNDRINGAAQVLKLLGNFAGKPPVPPLLEVSERCTKLIECLPAMQHDPKRPEDVLKVDIDDEGNGGDDPYEAFRYGVMAVVPRARYSEEDIESYTSQSY